MAESYSVKAILSAVDRGFSSTFRSCFKALDKIDTKISGFSFGILTGAGQAAFNMVTSSAMELVSEIDNSNAAWKTFGSNMKMLGKDSKEINKVTKELQSYAEQTVYSSSDMATTFAQLEAVGVKGTLNLVKGFGGLAAAAENPQQAMKTLSQQATQMAAKPTVAWADFKLMLEQTPAGIAAVAKQMGMTTAELVTAVQSGEIATQDFFDAIQAVGTNDSFTQLATEAKTMGQAFDGAKEALANKLMPAFDLLSQKGITAIEGISAKISEINAEDIATKVASWCEKAQPYWEAFKETAADVGDAIKKVGTFLGEHSDTIAKVLPWVLKLALAYKGFKIVSTVLAPVAGFTKAIAGLAGKGIGAIASKLFGISSAQKAVGTASAQTGTSMLTSAKAFALMGTAVLEIAVAFALLAQSAIALSDAGGLAIGVMAGLVVGIAALGVGMVLILKTLAPMGAQLMPVATAMLAMGAAVVLVSTGFALLAQSSIALADAGTPAILVMTGMVAAIALLAVGAAALAPVLTAGAVGLLAFGAAIVLCGAGAVLAATSLVILSTCLPELAANGTQGAVAILALGSAMIVFGAGAAVAGAGAVVLAVGFIAVAAGLVAASAALLALTAGILTLTVGVLALSVGVTALGASLALVGAAFVLIGSIIPTVAAGTLALVAEFTALIAIGVLLTATLTALNVPLVLIGASSLVASAGMLAFGVAMTTGAVGTLAMAAALLAVTAEMVVISSKAKSAEKSLKSMRESISLVEEGLNALESKAKDAMNKLKKAFDDTAKDAEKSGKAVGENFSKGMEGELGKAPNIATKAVMTVNNTLKSGHGGAYSAGAYISQGFAQGMQSCLGQIQAAAAAMVAAAEAAIRAKAMIHSPSRLTEKLGNYFGEGFEVGIVDMFGAVKKASEKLVAIPQVQTPQLAFAGGYGYELSDDFEYTRNSQYTIEVPLSVDGREFAKATASYTEEELNRKQSRDYRKQGRI